MWLTRSNRAWQDSTGTVSSPQLPDSSRTAQRSFPEPDVGTPIGDVDPWAHQSEGVFRADERELGLSVEVGPKCHHALRRGSARNRTERGRERECEKSANPLVRAERRGANSGGLAPHHSARRQSLSTVPVRCEAGWHVLPWLWVDEGEWVRSLPTSSMPRFWTEGPGPYSRGKGDP